MFYDMVNGPNNRGGGGSGGGVGGPTDNLNINKRREGRSK